MNSDQRAVFQRRRAEGARHGDIQYHGVMVAGALVQNFGRRTDQAARNAAIQPQIDDLAGAVRASARPDIRERLEGAGAQAVGGTPEEMTLYIKREFSRWSKLIKTVGIRVD